MVGMRLRELLEDLQLKVTVAGHTLVPADWKHENHVTVNNCLYLFTEGEGSLRIRDSAFLPRAGELYVLPAGAKISYSTSPERPFRLYFCHFHAYVGQAPLFQVADTPLSIRLNDFARVEGIFQRLVRAFQSKTELAPLDAKAAMFELLHAIWDQEPRKPAPINSAVQAHWDEIVRYIRERMTEPLSVHGIAQAFNYSDKYFFRLFKARMGMTPHQYIVKLRMEKARQLLLTTDWTTSRIASELGMERAHFSRTFLGYSDMTPKHFRAWSSNGIASRERIL